MHAVAREVKEETGLDVTRIVRKVGEFGWAEFHKRRQRHEAWQKLIFEVEVKDINVKLDPIEHQDFLWATEEEVSNDKSGNVTLTWITKPNKDMNMEGFRLHRETPQDGDKATQ